MYLYHDSRKTQYRSPFGAVPVSTEVFFHLDAEVPEGTRVYLRLWTDHETKIPMERDDTGFSVTATMPAEAGLLWYYFVAEAPEETLYYGRTTNSTGGTGTLLAAPPESWQITVYEETALPDWYRSSVAYQIFPDRFHRGGDWKACQRNAAHPEGWQGTRRIVMQDWNDTPFYCKDTRGRVIRWPFFGGTLEGIREKLPYLKSLGIGVLYLNPIFLASSNHKYDTADYLRLDPGFGTEADFSRLCSEAAENGIRILLDGVFSHTGDDSVYFNRFGNYPEPGACSSEESPYDGWYRFSQAYDCGYESWWGVDSLPNVEENAPGFRSLICGENGVIRKWLRLGASGWRLDVADELPDDFIAEIRRAAKQEKPDALILGEVWEDASNKVSYGRLRRYLLGRELDCTMHYPFRTGALGFLLGRQSAGNLSEALDTIRENYPPSALYGALNLTGTHDTPRILTVLGEAPEGLSEAQQEEYRLSPSQRSLALRRLRLLLVMQLCSPGVPCVYYGDEAGMEGYADPFNRGTFPWGREDGDLTFWVRMLSHLRREYPVLVSGSVAYGSVGDHVFAMTRTEGDVTAQIYVNRSDVMETVPAAGFDRLDLLTGSVLPAGQPLSLSGMTAVVLYHEGPGTAISPLTDFAKIPTGKGLLCPLFSLPGTGAVGTMADALRFLPAIKEAGFTSWMLLPLCPAGLGNSPYSSSCVLAGDPRYISPELPVDMGGFDAFCRENEAWLPDYALYTVLRRVYQAPWQQWPKTYRTRQRLSLLQKKYAGEIRAVMEEQYRFFAQWDMVHQKARNLGIALIGDLPIYAAVDSAEAWAHPEQFQLDEIGYPTLRAGCPPDYFSPEGQDWGNPLYRWDAMARDGFSWWKIRLRQALRCFDYVRLDHFRSFGAYYAIPAGETAKNGHWMKGAGVAFFREMQREFGFLPILAEDLGALDAQVTVLLRHTGLPGMNVWQFSEPEMTAMPPEVAAHRVFFSGTHDNQTLRGYLTDTGDERTPEAVLKTLLRLPSAACILPVLDVLGLGDEARINVPGVPEGNWTWRMTEAQLESLRQGGILGRA